MKRMVFYYLLGSLAILQTIVPSGHANIYNMNDANAMASSFLPGAMLSQASTNFETGAMPFYPPPTMAQGGIENIFNAQEHPMGPDMMGLGPMMLGLGGMENAQKLQEYLMMHGYPMGQEFSMMEENPMEQKMMEREMMEREMMEREEMIREELEREMMEREMMEREMRERERMAMEMMERERSPPLLNLFFFIADLIGTSLDLRGENPLENVLGLVSVIEMLTMIDEK